MSAPMLTLGLAVLGFLYPWAAFRLYEAYSYRDHSYISFRAELRGWVVVLGLWTTAVFAAAYAEGVIP